MKALLSFCTVLFCLFATVGEAEAAEFIRGDANLDSRVDLADAIFLLVWQFREGAQPACMDGADINDDGRTDLADAVYLLQWLFRDGPEIPPPGTSCGVDPTPDTLGCDEPPMACTGGPSIQVRFLPTEPTRAGETFAIEVMTVGPDGTPVYDSFFDVFVEVHPQRSDALSQLPPDPVTGEPRTRERIFELEDLGGGLYGTDFRIDVAGPYGFQVYVVDTRTGDKVPELYDAITHEVLPTELVELELVSPEFSVPVIFTGRDRFGNAVPMTTEDVVVTPADAVLEVTGVETVPAGRPESTLLAVQLAFHDYALSAVEIRHPGSGATLMAAVGFAPWKVSFSPPPGVEPLPIESSLAVEHGLAVNSFFDVFVDLQIPEGAPHGWASFSFPLAWPVDAPIELVEVKPGHELLTLTTEGPIEVEGYNVLLVNGAVAGGQELGTTPKAIDITFHAVDVTIPLGPPDFQVPQPGPHVADGGGTPIPYNPALFLAPGGPPFFWSFLFTVKPVKTLTMHVYRVEGAATEADIRTDVNEAQNMFNLNAFLCSLPFYVQFNLKITTIPKRDWNKIDEDGDGLDRYDSNGDGDYADPGDNNDLLNAMLEDYYDVGPNTENVYYVPSIRGGAMGTTYWPNGQVAIDNSSDSDNLTLAHEKVHEMDMRKDGDFDVEDGADTDPSRPGVQRDPTANAQGAYGPGNIMNYGNTGRLLTRQQGQHLDP